MKFILIMLSLGLVIASSAQAGVAKTLKAKKSTGVVKKQKAPSDLQTSHNFEDHGVAGEYQMPDEALAKVENEKSLSDLLGVRKHFKDRLAEASEQE